MKAKIINKEGKKKEIELPRFFSGKIREDIINKAIEIEKKHHPYSPEILAGMKYSASGKIRHMRHKWKTAYGYGISRVPRKIMWRRGNQFYWIGATVSGTVGGRRAHPPKIKKEKKINKKEYFLALKSAIASTASLEFLKKRYKRLENKEIKISLPLVIDSSVLNLKTKEFINFLKKLLGELYEIALQKKSVRAGKGKLRGRRYKKNAGLLLIIGKNEEKKIKGIDVKKSNNVLVSDIGKEGGRLAIYTENAIKELAKLDMEEGKWYWNQ